MTDVSIVQGSTQVSIVGSVPLVDDQALTLGTDGTVTVLYETADANANATIFVAPEGGATDVPAFIFGDASILNADLGWFNGLTEPSIVVVNDAKDAYIRIDAGDDAVAGSKGIYFKAAADEDIELINLSVTGTPRLYWNETDSLFQSTVGLKATVLEATTHFHMNSAAGIVYFGTGTDSANVVLKSRDNGVGWVDVGAVYSAADPYILIGRDDTGVATNAITDGLVLRMGAGTNNEAAGHGFGIKVMLGNAASEVEERGSIDLRLVTATNGSEDTGWDISTMAAGAINLAFKVDQVGELYADADGSSASYLTNGVNLFDDFDDAEELRKFQLTVANTGLITEVERQANRQRMVALGIWEDNPLAHSGKMMRIQPMFRLMAGGIWQTRQYVEVLEQRIVKLEEELSDRRN